jgi:hypothetical protein
MRQQAAAFPTVLVMALLMALLAAGCGAPATPPASSGSSTAASQPAAGQYGSTTAPPGSGPQYSARPDASASEGAAPGSTDASTAPGTDAGTPADSAPPGAPSSSAWKTFTTSDGTLSFDYPAAWTVRDPAGEAPLGGEFVDVVNAAGKQMAALRTNVVTGAECGDQQPYQLFDSEPMQALAEPGAADHPAPRYVFEGRGDFTAAEASPPTVASYGITMMPEEPGPMACPMFQLFLWPPSGALFGQVYNPATNTTPGDPGLPYLEKAKLYAGTAEYQDVRRMITSLRPAGKGPAGNGAATELAK